MTEIRHITKGVLLTVALGILFFSFRFLLSNTEKKPGRFVAEAVTPSTALSTLQGNGKILFQENCAACHSLFKDHNDLLGVGDRWPDKSLLILWIRNWKSAVATGDPYAVDIANRSDAMMKTFEHLNDEEIEAILAFIRFAETARDKTL